MAKRIEVAPENYFGITNAKELEKIAGGLASLRLMELEMGPPWTNFTRAGLMEIHGYVLQDIYPWGRHDPYRRGSCYGDCSLPRSIR